MQKETITVKLTKDQWLNIGDIAGWTQNIGFGFNKFKFWQGPGTYCVCPHCGHMKRSVLLMPCEKMTCPRCGKLKMERRYVQKERQMSPIMSSTKKAQSVKNIEGTIERHIAGQNYIFNYIAHIGDQKLENISIKKPANMDEYFWSQNKETIEKEALQDAYRKSTI